MSKRTYLPKLLFVMRTMCGYIRRWEPQIKEIVGDGNTAKVDAVLAACTILEAVVVPLVPNGG